MKNQTLYATIVLGSLLSGWASTPPGISPTELVRRVVANELKAQDEDHSHWMYRLELEEQTKMQVREVIETSEGELSRLLYVDGRPVSEEEQRKEDRRLKELINNLDKRKKIQQARSEDGDEERRLLRMLPDALLFRYREDRADSMVFDCEPNPRFKPPSHEARVFHAMQGQIWVNKSERRLMGLSGHLTHDVKFGGGLLGHLDRGGWFEVRQAEVAPGHWEMVRLNVEMQGRILFFKTIRLHQRESRSEFHRVPDDLTLAQAVAMLRRQALVARNRSD